MHPEARNFTLWARDTLPDYFSAKRVLDVGAGDINGNNRFLFDDCEYEGNDVAAAPNVTIVSKTKDLPFESASFDTIVSSECFEHDPELPQSLEKILQLLKPGGLLFFTCATTGRPEHGTRRTTPGDSVGTMAGCPDMHDYYHNVTLDDLEHAWLDAFSGWAAYQNVISHDLYFIGVKRGGEDAPLPLSAYEAPGTQCLSFKQM